MVGVFPQILIDDGSIVINSTITDVEEAIFVGDHHGDANGDWGMTSRPDGAWGIFLFFLILNLILVCCVYSWYVSTPPSPTPMIELDKHSRREARSLIIDMDRNGNPISTTMY